MKRWYDIKAKDDDTAEVLIYGDIGESFWGSESTTAKEFVEALAAIGDKKLTVRINSYGGSVADGLAIYNAIRRHPKGSTVEIDGVAVSAASLVAMAGDTVRMAENALLMIHAPWGMAVGNAKEMRDMAATLDKYAEAMVASYQRKTGAAREDMLALITDGVDHWFTAEEAKAQKFVDDISASADASVDAAVFARYKPPLKIAASLQRFAPTGALPPSHDGTQPKPAPKAKQELPMPEATPAQPGAANPVIPATARDPKDLREIAELTQIAAKYGVADKVAGWIDQGLTPAQIGKEILFANASKPAPQPSAEMLDMPDSDRRRYSYARAILMAASGDLDGLELEVHNELAKKVPNSYKPRGGVFVPVRLRPSAAGLDSRTAKKGAEVVFDEPGELIDLLRNMAVAVRLGARVLTGLQGPVSFTKQTGAGTATWVGENPGADVADSNLTLGLATLNPKTLQSSTSYSRQLLATANIDVESLVRNDLAAIHALAWDKAVLHGSGASNEPTGVYVAPDVNAVAMGGVPTFGKLVDMATEVAKDNALFGNLGFVTTPGMSGKLMQTLVASAAGSAMIWSGNHLEGSVAGYRALTSNQVSSTLGAGSEHGIVFANWADVLVGMWAGLEIIVDPYRLKKQGMIEVTSFQMTDVLLRRGESFTKSTGATI